MYNTIGPRKTPMMAFLERLPLHESWLIVDLVLFLTWSTSLLFSDHDRVSIRRHWIFQPHSGMIKHLSIGKAFPKARRKEQMV
mmetsp:Transcript_27083/g.34556  ORF Transcript_27083/g.34556 Transcript_27083/m.34556 type:complete len:83 (-) Transcript_27083:403-651(-)